jgi:broad specificity phosphatase PhoE
VTPPGGESAADFLDRIAKAAEMSLLPHLARRPLLVGSKGVARAFRELLDMPRAKGLANGELLQLDLAKLRRRDTIGCHV